MITFKMVLFESINSDRKRFPSPGLGVVRICDSTQLPVTSKATPENEGARRRTKASSRAQSTPRMSNHVRGAIAVSLSREY